VSWRGHYGAEPVGEATIENGASFGERSEPKEKPQPEPNVTYPRKSYGAEPVGEATIENGASFGERSEPKEKPQPEPNVTYPRKS
jgi:hypothetical protein